MASRKVKKHRVVDAAPSEGVLDKKQFVSLWAKPRDGDPHRTMLLTENEARRLILRLEEALGEIDAERRQHGCAAPETERKHREDRFGRQVP